MLRIDLGKIPFDSACTTKLVQRVRTHVSLYYRNFSLGYEDALSRRPSTPPEHEANCCLSAAAT